MITIVLSWPFYSHISKDLFTVNQIWLDYSSEINTHFFFFQIEGVGFQVLKVQAFDADVSPENSRVTYSILVSFNRANMLNTGLKEHQKTSHCVSKNNIMAFSLKVIKSSWYNCQYGEIFCEEFFFFKLMEGVSTAIAHNDQR